MKSVQSCLLPLLLVIAHAALGQTIGVDWKLYGFAVVNGESQFCFYDSKGVSQRPDKHLRVWTKCLAQTDIEAIDITKDFDGQIVKNAAQKVAHYYVPPIARVQTVDAEQSVVIAGYEETANIGIIQPRAQIFYELDCSERMLQELSISINANGKVGSVSKPGEWKYVAPEGNASSLLTILCPMR